MAVMRSAVVGSSKREVKKLEDQLARLDGAQHWVESWQNFKIKCTKWY